MDDKASPGQEHLVLLVDDEDEFAQVVSKRLARRGLAMVTALSGAEALRLARARDFQVALVDIKMEGLDGLETLKGLRTLLPGIRVIMITGHGSAELARQCQELGAFAYLNKPCDLSELVEKIQAALACPAP